MTVEFELEGQDVYGAQRRSGVFKFTEAISFVVNCKTQAEVDNYWKKLSAGGKRGAAMRLAERQIRTYLGKSSPVF